MTVTIPLWLIALFVGLIVGAGGMLALSFALTGKEDVKDIKDD